MTLSQIRHVFGDMAASKFIRAVKQSTLKSDYACPFCNSAMLSINTPEPLFALQACRNCAVVWFDLPTYEMLPRLTLETTNSVQMQATEIIALNRLKELKRREAEEQKAERKKRWLGARVFNRPPRGQAKQPGS